MDTRCLWIFLTIIGSLQTGLHGVPTKSLHHHMSKREVEYYFGAFDHDSVPEYDVATAYETDENGDQFVNDSFLHSRRKRNDGTSEPLFYKLKAFGRDLHLKLKRNEYLMAPNLKVTMHSKDGSVTSHPVPENTFYHGYVLSDPDSTVAVSNDGGLTGMVATSQDALFVHPLPVHLAKHVAAEDDATPHLVYKRSLKQDDFICETKNGYEISRVRRSDDTQDAKPITYDFNVTKFKYLEGWLIAPYSMVTKYQEIHFQAVLGGVPQYLMLLANIVAGMFQDPSLGKIKLTYVVTGIAIINTAEAKINANSSNIAKLISMFRWAAKNERNLPPSDVFSYVSNGIPSGGLANTGVCLRGPSGSVNKDIGLQTALHIAHEIGHNLYLDHDEGYCAKSPYIMHEKLPAGKNAWKWSKCSQQVIQKFLNDGKRSKCLDNYPGEGRPTLPPAFRDKLPGQVVDGDMQCKMQYGPHYRHHYQYDCGALNCLHPDGTILTRNAAVADGTKCGLNKWCIHGACQISDAYGSVDGGWSNWSPYSTCSSPCGAGFQRRNRKCTNPRPHHGRPCQGKGVQYRSCNVEQCVNGMEPFRTTSRKVQCEQKFQNSTNSYYLNWLPCRLICVLPGELLDGGAVPDGTKCNQGLCLNGVCEPSGCDYVLGSGKKLDRCGKCGGDGETCVVITETYKYRPRSIGPENAGLIVELPINTSYAYFRLVKPTRSYLGVADEHGRYLVGGHMGFNQRKHTAGADIQYMHERTKYDDRLAISGPTTAPLKVMFIRNSPNNPGVRMRYLYFPQPGLKVPAIVAVMFKWKVGEWKQCSRTCAIGERKREVSCVREDDGTPASDSACPPDVPSTTEQCNTDPCPAFWKVSPDWGPCSKSCGEGGKQERPVVCTHEVSKAVFQPTNILLCSPDQKPQVETVRYGCNKVNCPAEWRVANWSECSAKCAKGTKQRDVACMRIDEDGVLGLLSEEFCRYRVKPTNKTSCNDIDPCGPRSATCPVDHVCNNGGQCVEHPDGYVCACPAGYIGLECEIETACASTPCLNGGICVDDGDFVTYKCNCREGYRGDICQDRSATCPAKHECINGGQCTPDPDGYKCACPAGYTGVKCEVPTACTTKKPCVNGGICTDNGDLVKYTCKCKGGFRGGRCHIAPTTPIGCFRTKEGLINEISMPTTNTKYLTCAELAHNKSYEYFSLGLQGKCLSSSDANTKFFAMGSAHISNCKRRIGNSIAHFVYTFETIPKYNRLGCYLAKNDLNQTALRTKYISFRNQLKPQDKRWTVRQCAIVAYNKGIRYFAVQNYGDCMTDQEAETRYALFGKTGQCVAGVGKRDANCVYEIRRPT